MFELPANLLVFHMSVLNGDRLLWVPAVTHWEDQMCTCLTNGARVLILALIISDQG